MSRKPISLKTKLASALLQMRRDDGNGRLVLIITHEEALTLTADEIISRFDFHHYPIPHAHGGPDEPWNLDPILREEHKRITATQTIPAVAKTKRIQAREAGEVKGGPKIKSAGFRRASPQRSASRPLVRRSGAEAQ